jgi:hypothetical protein
LVKLFQKQEEAGGKAEQLGPGGIRARPPVGARLGQVPSLPVSGSSEVKGRDCPAFREVNPSPRVP